MSEIERDKNKGAPKSWTHGIRLRDRKGKEGSKRERERGGGGAGVKKE